MFELILLWRRIVGLESIRWFAGCTWIVDVEQFPAQPSDEALHLAH